MKIAQILVAGSLLAASGMASAAYTWATVAESFSQGLQQDGNPVPPERSDTSMALGAPQDSDGLPPPINFVSLGFGGSLTLSFGTQFKDEVAWYETTFNANGGAFEEAELYVGVGNDPNTAQFYYVAELSNLIEGVPSSLAAVQGANNIFAWDYVKLVDVSGPIGNFTFYDGWDVDAVGVIPVPAPAGAAVLGFAGLALARRRR